jgi:hypothetical protein
MEKDNTILIENNDIINPNINKKENNFFRQLKNVLENQETKDFFTTYFNDIDNIKTSMMFVTLYIMIEEKLKHSTKSNFVSSTYIIEIIEKIFNDTKSRSNLCRWFNDKWKDKNLKPKLIKKNDFVPVYNSIESLENMVDLEPHVSIDRV